MIVNMTRSTILMEVNGRRITLRGEAYLPGYGSPDFIIAKDSFLHWDAADTELISGEERKEILAQLTDDFASKGMRFEVEE